jgi:hypothetical protein
VKVWKEGRKEGRKEAKVRKVVEGRKAVKRRRYGR